MFVIRYTSLRLKKTSMISLIITVKNERHSLPAWFKSIKEQTRQPDEIVIVDGGSSDGTWEWLQTVASPTIKIFQKVGNIASGRNHAIEQAQGDSIAVTDAGCTYAKDWFQKLVSPFNEGAQFVATAFRPWVEENDKLLFFLLAAATTPARQEFSKSWLPSSRSVAFQKSAWKKVGGYPEWIPFCEDVIFDLRLIKTEVQPYLVREPLVAWFTRPTFGKYFHQLFNYTRSDGHGKLWYGRQLTRFAVYGGLVVCLYAAFTQSHYWIIPALIGGCVYMYKFWRRFSEFATKAPLLKKMVGYVLLPFVIFIGDLAKMLGWVTGVLERWSGKVRFEQWK